jgi:hypothetical protein
MTEPVPSEESQQEPPAAPESDVNRELARAVGELTAGGPPSKQQVSDLVRLSARSAKEAGTQAVTSGRWITEVLLDVAGHLNVRDVETLRAHYHGKDGPELAEALVRNASRMSAAVGAATGAIVAASQLSLAAWATLPIELLAETLIVVSVELKLVSELSAIARQPFTGGITERASAAARVWADNQGQRPGRRTRGDLGMLGRQARIQLTSQMQKLLMRRAGRNIWSLLPFLIGAVAGGELNRRATLQLGDRVARSYGLRRL